MPIVSPGPSQPSSVPWGVALAATSVLLIAGGAILWMHREAPAPGFGDVADARPAAGRRVPTPPIDGELPHLAVRVPVADAHAPGKTGSGVYSVAYGFEHGTRVVKIRVVPDGDELVIDLATGRLIETRPGRRSAPPVGRFAAPFVPAT